MCGVLAGVGARSPIGELMSWRKGRLSSESLESTASSSTFCNSVFTWPLSNASPEPGVFFTLLLPLCFANGVSRLPPFASPTIGESFVMSISADRSCCCCALLCLDFDMFFSESSIFPDEKKEKRKINVNPFWNSEMGWVLWKKVWIFFCWAIWRKKRESSTHLKLGCCYRWKQPRFVISWLFLSMMGSPLEPIQDHPIQKTLDTLGDYLTEQERERESKNQRQREEYTRLGRNWDL